MRNEWAGVRNKAHRGNVMSEERKEGMHTAEPWSLINGTDRDGENYISISSKYGSATILYADNLSTANARRIVACVNYCAGLPTYEMEGMPDDEGDIVWPSAKEEIEFAELKTKEAKQQRTEADAARRAANVEVLALTQQRDALLAALKSARTFIDGLKNDKDFTSSELQKFGIEPIDAAIAAAGGAQ